MRHLLCGLLMLLILCWGQVSSGQPPAGAKSKAPKLSPPDAATHATITARMAELRTAITSTSVTDPDVLVYLKAVEWIERHNEWLHPDSVKWTLECLDTGFDRLKSVRQHPWTTTVGRWVVRGYRSSVDGSIQPYAVMLPPDFFTLRKPRRLDVILHGRDATLTEAKFLANHNGSKAGPKDFDAILVEVYGRGNNAYRWSGETDVLDVLAEVAGREREWGFPGVDRRRIVLRGFSMGGAGTWHIGLHHPSMFAVIGPGAGFTTTRGYIAKFPAQQPDHVEKCLHIYDAVDYAENVFNVPVVAYSGEKDPQKLAADLIEKALETSSVKSPDTVSARLRIQHLVAPGLEHKQPPEWQAKLDTQYRKFTDPGRPTPDRVRFVTYTPAYGLCEWVRVVALEKQYEKALFDAVRVGPELRITTTNVRQLAVVPPKDVATVVINESSTRTAEVGAVAVVTHGPTRRSASGLMKAHPLCGPIDDAFRGPFTVPPPRAAARHPLVDRATRTSRDAFAKSWDQGFRGRLPENGPAEAHEVLFGDPLSQPRIAELLPKLPIIWTAETLEMNGVRYDAKTHLPVLIYPHPIGSGRPRYVVLNSGHTFTNADLNGTNALLYPRLGDWAVVKVDGPSPEVVAAGLFDEDWQFVAK